MKTETTHLFVETAHRITWCALVTVGAGNRPRSRVVHPLWEATGSSIVGWVGTRPTPLKVAHVDHSPFASCAYLAPDHDYAVAECSVEWVVDAAERALVWERFTRAPAPVGYDPATIWRAPDAHDFAVLRLTPWRLAVGIASEMATGERPHVWRAPLD